MSLTKISDYMQLSKEDRQKHIDLSTECQFHYFERDYNWNGKIKKAGDLYNKISQMKKAKMKLLDELNIEDFGGYKIHLCHLCNCDSGNDKVCVNPLHLYFGTASENVLDKTVEVRQKAASKAGKIGAKSQLENKTHMNFKTVQCPHCIKEGSLPIMKRWHFDNCKHKPISVISQNISNLIPESSSTNLE